MKLGLLGGSGQIGFDIQRAARVRQLTVSAPSSQEVDVRSAQQVDDWVERSQCELYLNCAAFTAVDAAESDPDTAYAINATGAANLTHACAKRGSRVLYLSTDYVFDGATTQPYSEAAPTAPLSVYGASKLAGEQATLAEPNNQVLRVSWVFGVHGHNFVKSILRAAMAGKALTVVDDQFGTPCSARSIAEAALTLIQRPKIRNLYHFCASEVANWHQFAEAIVTQAAESRLLEEVPRVATQSTRALQQAAQRPPHAQLDGTALHQDHNITACDWRTDLHAVLEELKTSEFSVT